MKVIWDHPDIRPLRRYRYSFEKASFDVWRSIENSIIQGSPSKGRNIARRLNRHRSAFIRAATNLEELSELVTYIPGLEREEFWVRDIDSTANTLRTAASNIDVFRRNIHPFHMPYSTSCFPLCKLRFKRPPSQSTRQIIWGIIHLSAVCSDRHVKSCRDAIKFIWLIMNRVLVKNLDTQIDRRTFRHYIRQLHSVGYFSHFPDRTAVIRNLRLAINP